METKKAKYHITITDNETGKTCLDQDTAVIIGAVDAGEPGVRALALCNCNDEELYATLAVAQIQVNHIMSCKPKAHMRRLKRIIRKHSAERLADFLKTIH